MAQPRFKFPLEALLEHRLLLEKEQQRIVAKIHQQAQLLAREIQQAEARIIAENKTLTAEKLLGPLDMQYIGIEKRFVGNLHMQIALTLQRLAGTERELAAARRELLVAARARKVIEKLKEKQLARWRVEQEHKEADAMDEIGTQVAMRESARRELEAADALEINLTLPTHPQGAR